MPEHTDTLELRLARIEHAGKDTQVYRFSRCDGGVLPSAFAGSHIAVLLPTGMERQYSILEPGTSLTNYAVGVKKESAGLGGSAFIHDMLRVGDLVPIRLPRNNFPLTEDASYSLLIAGGIGVTPLIAMAKRLCDLDRPFAMHVACRAPNQAILDQYLRHLPNLMLHFDDRAGGLFPMPAVIDAAPKDAHLYCCGPSAMLKAFLDCAKHVGKRAEFVHVEYFSATEKAATDGGFIVELARSGRTLTVPSGKSILAALREAGVSVLSNCEQGTCGACEVAVLGGIPDHRDAVLPPSERKKGKTMMLCCSGALTDRLVLDL